jgi:hypothetical protein
MTWVIANVPGEGYPECDWDFAAEEGFLKITANCPGACITLEGERLEAFKDLMRHTVAETE